ncbi:MAG: hypothetical protein EXS55_03650 [Candidatus Magasanikbacteria bacterium]|nr:hypothetical protein [Candidatus Magasanikbacteria bacterium]
MSSRRPDTTPYDADRAHRDNLERIGEIRRKIERGETFELGPVSPPAPDPDPAPQITAPSRRPGKVAAAVAGLVALAGGGAFFGSKKEDPFLWHGKINVLSPPDRSTPSVYLPEMRTPDFTKIVNNWHDNEKGFLKTLELVNSYCDGREGRPGPEFVSLLMGVAKRESNGDPKSFSKAGAKGTWQVMPKNREDGDRLVTDERYCLKRGAEELQKHFKTFHGHIALTLLGYNMGPYGHLLPTKDTPVPRMFTLFNQWRIKNGQPTVDSLERATLKQLREFAHATDDYVGTMDYTMDVIAFEKVISENLGPQTHLQYAGGELPMQVAPSRSAKQIVPLPKSLSQATIKAPRRSGRRGS